MKTNGLLILLIAFMCSSCYHKSDKSFVSGKPVGLARLNDSLYKDSLVVYDSLIIKTQDAFIEKINALSIVKNYGKDLQNQTEGAHVAYLIWPFPSDTDSYFIIKAGYAGPLRFETRYNFYCYPRSGEMKLLDPLKDTLTGVGSIR